MPYKPSSYKNFVKFFKKHNFKVRQDGPHMIGVDPKNEEIKLSVPRSTTISNGVTHELCKKLRDLGYAEDEIRRHILK